MKDDILRNKNLYKVFITIIKYLPITLAVTHMISLTLNYFGMNSMLLSCFGGTSLLFIGLLYIISYVFRFCYLYRIPLWYSTVMAILFLLISLGYIPLEVIDLYRLYAIISGIFITSYISYAYKNRNNQGKIDYIRELCKRYCK